MIRILKINNLVYENFSLKEVNEEGEIIDNPIPNNLEELKNAAIDTIRWDAGRQLKKTDWVVTKISEIQVVGGDVEAVKAKYSGVLSQREAIRAKSNELEEKVNTCKTFEELLEVVKDLRI